MLKMVFFCLRRSDISHDAYAEMVLRDHVPLALRHHPTMRKYVVNIVDHVPTAELRYDSIAELSFDSAEDYTQHLYDSSEGERIILADVARFLAGAHAYSTTEHVHRELESPAPLGGRNPHVKLVCPIRRRDGMTHADFVDHWLNRHRPLALRHHPGLVRYVANVVDATPSEGAPELDGIGELYFTSPESLRDQMFDSPAGEDIILRDVETFIGHTCAYLATEHVQKRP